MTEALQQAREAESSLRSRLADAVAERARTTREADRLEARASLPGADAAVAAAATEQLRLAAQAASHIETLRAELRRAEGQVVTLEAALDAERAAREF